MNKYEEELNAEFNAGFDYISEAFGATARDCNEMARQDAEAEAVEAAAFIGPHQPFVDEIPF